VSVALWDCGTKKVLSNGIPLANPNLTAVLLGDLVKPAPRAGKMKIQTDFIPKPGDRIRRRYPSGQIHSFVWVICPDCSEGRWVADLSFKRLAFTGRYKNCNIIRAKKGGWSSLSYYFEGEY